MAAEDGAVEWSSEVGAADWIVERLHPVASDVGSFVPEGLEAYARVLHPARRVERGRPSKVRWADVARAAGTAVHPAGQFEALRPSPEIEPPLEGTLERTSWTRWSRSWPGILGARGPAGPGCGRATAGCRAAVRWAS